MTNVVANNNDSSDLPLVLQDLYRFLTTRQQPSGGSGSSESCCVDECSSSSSSLFDKSVMAVPVAAITTLLNVVQRSQAETMMGLQSELNAAATIMVQQYYQIHQQRSGSCKDADDAQQQTTTPLRTTSSYTSSSIALQSGIELFLKYITRSYLETPNFNECKQLILQRGERFQSISLAARDRIAITGSEFITQQNTTIVLTMGWSRVVAAILQQAASQSKQFSVYILEGRPDYAGVKAANCYANETNIPVTVIPDAAMAYILERVDIVLVGAEAVVENGGIVNKCGTAALAMCASVHNKPFYVAAESYKFARLYPLRQSDLPFHPPLPIHFVTEQPQPSNKDQDVDDIAPTTMLRPLVLSPDVHIENPAVDFTPAKFITLLFTDLGVLTPSAVSDELIRLYQ